MFQIQKILKYKTPDLIKMVDSDEITIKQPQFFNLHPAQIIRR